MNRALIVLTIFCMALTGSVRADLLEGLEAYWPLEGDLTDASGNGHDATPWGADPIFSDAVQGTGADLGTGAGAGTWNPSETTGSLTVACWVKWRSAAGASEWQGIIGKRDNWGAADVYWGIDMNVPAGTSTTEFGFQNNGGGWTGFGGNAVVDDEWTFICATIDGDNAGATATYWNGAEVSTGAITLPAASAGNQVVFGCVEDGGANPFSGMMDEVAIWNRALSAAEIAELYNGGEGMSMLGNPWKATNIAPANGIGGVPNDTDVILQWGAPTEAPPEPITRYDLYFSDNLGLVAEPNNLIPPTASVAAGDPLEYNAGLLAPDVYHWRVDAVISDHEPNIAYGRAWSFDTIPSPPGIISEPVGVMAAAGSTVQYEFVADSFTPVTYEWKKEGDAGFSEPGSVLTLENVSVADEGFYYCEATNAGGTTASASAGFELPKLLAHYKLDDVVAATDVDAPIADSGPFEHDGVEKGEVQSAAGIIDGALAFVGDGDYIDTGTWNPNVTSPELTVSIWAKWGGPNGKYHGLIGKRDSWGTDMMWQIGTDNAAGVITMSRDGSWPWGGDQILPVGEWAHVAVTFDGTTATMYINGVATGSGPFSLGSKTDAHLVIGDTGPGFQDPFNGDLDDAQIYNHALDPISVALLYTSGSGKTVCMGNPAFDFNGNCIVGISDFVTFAMEWMRCNLYPQSACP